MVARLRASLTAYGAALAGVAVMTALTGALLRVVPPATHVSIVYLIVILVAATRLGRGPAIVASIASFLAYDFFFTTPYHELTISQPDEWVSLVLFLLTALITGQVTANERARAEQATRREREAGLLLDVLRLMTDPDMVRSLHALAERVRSQLHVAAVDIELEVEGRRHAAAAGPPDAVALIRSGANAMVVLPGVHEPTATTSARTRDWVRVLPPHAGSSYDVLGSWRRYVVPVRIGDRGVGRIALVRAAGLPFDADDRFLAVVATQLSLLVQRAELEVVATEAEVLRRASELKSALLNAVSHDLRTPLASILASAESLLQKDVAWSDEDRDGSAREIVQEARRLDRIVGNLLDLSRIEAGALRPEKRLYDLLSVIGDAAARLEGGARVAVQAPADLPPVPLDPVEVDQVLANLLENALKNSPPSSPVDVSVRVSGAEVVLEVADRGAGIPPEDASYVFEPFYRILRNEARPSGVGLGLAVAKGLVDAHGGRIWVTQRQGGGACFCVALPLTPDAPPDGVAARIA